MKDNIENKLNNIWDHRWQGSEKSERLTLIGQMMFKSKKITLHKVLKKYTSQNMIENVPVFMDVFRILLFEKRTCKQ